MAILVTVRNNNVEKAMRVLKKKLQKDGLFKELRQREYYEKPSEKRIRKGKEMAAAWRKKERLRKLKDGI
jgi:small subunit ribosomal protein S21|tara:strand:+ start:124 stop:333 length:210 start_codon:yes stop_codon:yes gene_type:complete